MQWYVSKTYPLSKIIWHIESNLRKDIIIRSELNSNSQYTHYICCISQGMQQIKYKKQVFFIIELFLFFRFRFLLFWAQGTQIHFNIKVELIRRATATTTAASLIDGSHEKKKSRQNEFKMCLKVVCLLNLSVGGGRGGTGRGRATSWHVCAGNTSFPLELKLSFVYLPHHTLFPSLSLFLYDCAGSVFFCFACSDNSGHNSGCCACWLDMPLAQCDGLCLRSWRGMDASI